MFHNFITTLRKFPVYGKKSFPKSFRISRTFSIVKMEKNSGSFPYVNRNPEFWWKPYPQLDIKRTIWKGLSVKTRNKKQEEKRN